MMGQRGWESQCNQMCTKHTAPDNVCLMSFEGGGWPNDYTCTHTFSRGGFTSRKQQISSNAGDKR